LMLADLIVMSQDFSRRVSDSQTTITELMIPAYANFGGKIHGGILLSLMDKVAYACASKHAGRYCVTVSVDRVEFLEPVEVGELVSLKASVNYVGRSSLIVGIRVESMDVRTSKVKHTNSSFFTMVAKGDDDKPAQVPVLILETHEDVKRFIEARRLKSVKEKVKAEMNDLNSLPDISHASEILANERCIIKLIDL
jgi:acyl-CoA hydrolase